MTYPAQHQQLAADRTNSADALFDDALAERVERTRRVLGVEPAPAHIEAAARRIYVGDWRRADSILACNVPGAFGYECKLRLDCPSCVTRAQQGLARSMVEAATDYTQPVAALITLPSKSLLDLAPTADSLVALLVTLRRSRWFRRGCAAGVGIIEVPRTADLNRWNVHVHAALDLRVGPDDVAEWQVLCEQQWAQLAGVAGARFSLERLRSLPSLAAYAAKLNAPPPSWAPAAGALPPTLERELRSALHRRRLLVRWGAKRARGDRHP